MNATRSKLEIGATDTPDHGLSGSQAPERQVPRIQGVPSVSTASNERWMIAFCRVLAPLALPALRGFYLLGTVTCFGLWMHVVKLFCSALLDALEEAGRQLSQVAARYGVSYEQLKKLRKRPPA